MGFLMAFLPRSRRNRNRDSCSKQATGKEKSGIRRIPAGIGNLVAKDEWRTVCINTHDNVADLLTETLPSGEKQTKFIHLLLHHI